jgi:hypothetical protein
MLSTAAPLVMSRWVRFFSVTLGVVADAIFQALPAMLPLRFFSFRFLLFRFEFCEFWILLVHEIDLPLEKI